MKYRWLAVLGVLFLSSIYALNIVYIDAESNSATISYDRLGDTVVHVKTVKDYVPFTLVISDLPKGNYSLVIPEYAYDTLVCAPTSFEMSDVGDETIYCIAKPSNEKFDVKLVREFNGTVDSTVFRFEIENVVVWYEVWKGGVESGYYLSNGVYVVELYPRELVAKIVVKKGGEVVWTGIMFPGTEENISEDLKIKFLGALDNVTYLEIYSTSDNKFNLYQVGGEEKVIYVQPVCREEGGKILLKNVVATVYYTDGHNETVDASNETVYLSKNGVAKVVCGPVLEFSTVVQQPEENKEEGPRFLIVPRSSYYVGDTVTITATDDFTISCSDGTSMTTRAFTKVFDQPTTCTVVLGDQTRTFTVRAKTTTSTTNNNKYNVNREKVKGYGIIALLIVLGLLYWKKPEWFEKIGFKKKPKEEGGVPKEAEDIEVSIKNTLEGEQ